jgi:hypothetical protein
MIEKERDGVIYLVPETEEDIKKIEEGIQVGAISDKSSFSDWKKGKKRMED